MVAHARRPCKDLVSAVTCREWSRGPKASSFHYGACAHSWPRAQHAVPGCCTNLAGAQWRPGGPHGPCSLESWAVAWAVAWAWSHRQVSTCLGICAARGKEQYCMSAPGRSTMQFAVASSPMENDKTKTQQQMWTPDAHSHRNCYCLPQHFSPSALPKLTRNHLPAAP